MQNFEPESAVIFVSSNSALIEKYLRNTCLGQGAIPTQPAVPNTSIYLFKICTYYLHTHPSTNTPLTDQSNCGYTT